MEKTDLESVKRYLEEKGEALLKVDDDEFPPKFLEHLILGGLRLDVIEPGRVVFTMNIPPSLLVRTLFNLFLLLLLHHF